MKKYFFFAATALLALGACTKVTPVEEPEQAITFNVVNHATATKADGDEGESSSNQTYGEYNTAVPFGTFAYMNVYDTPAWDNSGTTNNVYMNNVKVKYTGETSKTWEPDGNYYWPKKGYLTFASYSPYMTEAPSYTKEVINENTTTGGFKFENYTIKDSRASATAVSILTEDLMVADVAKDLRPESITQKYYRTGVPTLFRHLLTNLQFKFQRAPYDNVNVVESTSEITVTKVELIKFVNKRTYNDGAWTNPDGDESTADYLIFTGSLKIANEYTLAGEGETADVYGYKLEDGVRVLDNNATKLGADNIIVMPQALAAQKQTLKITYNIKTLFKGQESAVEEDGVVTEVEFVSGSVTEFGKNQKITYTITIYPYAQQKILFDPAVENWTESTGTITVE